VVAIAAIPRYCAPILSPEAGKGMFESIEPELAIAENK
jgi:hypothetical protein